MIKLALKTALNYGSFATPCVRHLVCWLVLKARSQYQKGAVATEDAKDPRTLDPEAKRTKDI
eukprot:4126104-Amphidinium_carterae.1